MVYTNFVALRPQSLTCNADHAMSPGQAILLKQLNHMLDMAPSKCQVCRGFLDEAFGSSGEDWTYRSCVTSSVECLAPDPQTKAITEPVLATCPIRLRASAWVRMW